MFLRSLAATTTAVLASTSAMADTGKSIVRLFSCETGDHNGLGTRSLRIEVSLTLDAAMKPVSISGKSLYEKRLYSENSPTIQILDQSNASLSGSIKSLQVKNGVVEIKLGEDGYADEGSDLMRQGVSMKAKTVLIVDGEMAKAKIFGTGSTDQIILSAGYDCAVESLPLLKMLGK